MKEKRNAGITLIALVVTLVIMLIIAGVALKELTGEEGIIAKAKRVKEITEYGIAKEEINIKLTEIIADCESRGVDYTIDEIYTAIEQDDEKEIEKIFNKETGSVKSGVSEKIVDLSDIVVSVKKYSKYKFLVGEKEGTGEVEGIKGVTTEKITNSTTKSEFSTINSFENILEALDNKEYMIKYNANGGSGTIVSETKRAGLSIVLRSASGLTREGYKFVGWEVPGIDEVLEPGNTVKVTGNMTIRAKWAKDTVKVSFNLNGGSGTREDIEVEKNKDTALDNSTISKDGYYFVKWTTTDGQEYTNKVNVDKNVTLIAQWKPIKFTVNVSGLGNTGWTQSVSVSEGSLSGYTKTYYISTTGTNTAQTTTTNASVTGKSELTTYYVWAVATKNSTTVKSTNYITISTGHKHTGDTSNGGGCYGQPNYSTCYFKYKLITLNRGGACNNSFSCLYCGNKHTTSDCAWFTNYEGVALTCTANHFSQTGKEINNIASPWEVGLIQIRWGCAQNLSLNTWYTSSVKHSTYVSSYSMNCNKSARSATASSTNF